MTVMIIVNAVFSVLVLAAMVGHLGRAIHHDRHRVRHHAMTDRNRVRARRPIAARRPVGQTDRMAA